MAAPASCPENHASRTAATLSSQGSSTGAPLLTTTTVRGFAARTARTRSSWRPGSASESWSNPSLSICSVVPTTTIATSAPGGQFGRARDLLVVRAPSRQGPEGQHRDLP